MKREVRKSGGWCGAAQFLVEAPGLKIYMKMNFSGEIRGEASAQMRSWDEKR